MLTNICHGFNLRMGEPYFVLFFRPNEEPVVVQERKCRGTTIPYCSQGYPLKDSSEARRLRDAWWFRRKGNVGSR